MLIYFSASEIVFTRYTARASCKAAENAPNTEKIIRKRESILCEGKGCERCADITTGKSVISMIPPVRSIEVIRITAVIKAFAEKYIIEFVTASPSVFPRSRTKLPRLPLSAMPF